MKFYNTVSKFITLQDGSRVDGNFYQTVKKHVEARYRHLNLDDNHSIANILGDEFLSYLLNLNQSKPLNLLYTWWKAFKFLISLLVCRHSILITLS
jgi:hypothetical protein